MPIGLILLFTVFIVCFGCLLLFLAAKLGQSVSSPNVVKSESYECGIPVSPKKQTNVSVKFYLTAILFIIFDIEIIFLLPWAIVFKDFIKSGQGFFIFSTMFVFLVLFTIGLFWEIKSKALDWE